MYISFFYSPQAAFSAPCSSVQTRRNVSDLKSVLAEKIPEKQEEVKAFRKQHGNTKVGEITVDMVRNNLATYVVLIISYIITICSYLKNRGHAKVIAILMHFYWALATLCHALEKCQQRKSRNCI